MRLVLDNGEVYPYAGKLLFSEPRSIQHRAGDAARRVPEPEAALLPGMYVRVQIEQGVDPDALAVPQQAVRRNDAGMSEVFVLRDDNRAVVAADAARTGVGDQWLIEEGLKPGDSVVVDGFQKFVAGDLVDPEPWQEHVEAARAARRTAVQPSIPLTVTHAGILHRQADLRLGHGAADLSGWPARDPVTPVAQYPIIAPPSISISTSYPGASPENLYNSVTRLIEEELNGATGILNFESTSHSLGRSRSSPTSFPAPTPKPPRSRSRTASSASKRGCRAP